MRLVVGKDEPVDLGLLFAVFQTKNAFYALAGVEIAIADASFTHGKVRRRSAAKRVDLLLGNLQTLQRTHDGTWGAWGEAENLWIAYPVGMLAGV